MTNSSDYADNAREFLCILVAKFNRIERDATEIALQPEAHEFETTKVVEDIPVRPPDEL